MIQTTGNISKYHVKPTSIFDNPKNRSKAKLIIDTLLPNTLDPDTEDGRERPQLTGVYLDKRGYAVASNSVSIVMVSIDSKIASGRVIGRTGVVATSYPDWIKALPQPSRKIISAQTDVETFAGYVSGAAMSGRKKIQLSIRGSMGAYATFDPMLLDSSLYNFLRCCPPGTELLNIAIFNSEDSIINPGEFIKSGIITVSSSCNTAGLVVGGLGVDSETSLGRITVF